MPVDDALRDEAVTLLVAAIDELFADMDGWVLHAVSSALNEVDPELGAQFESTVFRAWDEVRPTRAAVRAAAYGLDAARLEDHGLYGAELAAKLALWRFARDRALRAWDQAAVAQAPTRAGLVRRALRKVSNMLGHADTWLESFIKASGQHERLAEIKKTVEKAAGDAGADG